MLTQDLKHPKTKPQQQTKCPVSAVFQTEEKINNVIRQLLKQDIPRDEISVSTQNKEFL
ncbi:MAG: hypothetical protein F6K09_18595 [Merismopedia sp. SIO2A8]|nr:hypothetical protein [Symploca sp. SIO2B6]NET50659.1 hypothetical protein [Merismopedia sp. SIO2A8]